MEYTNKVKHRLSRIEGQVRGVLGMMEQEKPCKDVVTQLSAIRTAVDQVIMFVVGEKMEQCKRDEIAGGGSADQVIQEAINLLMKEPIGGCHYGYLDLPAKLHEKDVELDMQYRVPEVCNPNEANRVLTQNPLVGYFLPCKVVVYQSEGKTHIGLPKPTALMEEGFWW
jgi:DNA-binding FrmR family transcriptional regulator